jgi:hypothetical protein
MSLILYPFIQYQVTQVYLHNVAYIVTHILRREKLIKNKGINRGLDPVSL